MSFSPPIAWYVARWGDEPFSRGSWSALAPGGTPAHRTALGTPVDGRFMVAGDATNPVAPSMTHGAYDEGVRAGLWAAHQVGAKRVLVVGAGFAGLGAASTLRDLGVAVTVLEARDRIGGRAHSVDVCGVVADAGGAWLQQGPTNSLSRVASQLGLRTVPTDFHAPLAAAPDGPVGDVAGALASIAAVAARSAPDASLAAVLDSYLVTLSPSERRTARHAIDLELDLENGGPHHRLSAHSVFAEPGVGVDDRWLPGGYRQLLDHLATDVDVRLDRPVQRIAWNADGVTLVSGGDRFDADCCICTIPVWLLPEVDLSPGLPAAHLDALSHITVGLVEKVILRFEERWWPVAPSGYLRWYDSPASWGEWLDLTDGVGVPTVAALIAGDAVRRVHHGRTDAEVAMAVADALGAWALAVGSSRSSAT
jgi:monoamine oxidase